MKTKFHGLENLNYEELTDLNGEVKKAIKILQHSMAKYKKQPINNLPLQVKQMFKLRSFFIRLRSFFIRVRMKIQDLFSSISTQMPDLQ